MRIRHLPALALLVLCAATAGAQDDKPAAPAVSLTAKAGDTFTFRRTRARTAVCEQLARHGDDKITQAYVVEVKSRRDDGGLAIEIRFGEAQGHFTTSAGERIEFDTAKPLPEIESVPDMVGLRTQTMLAGATVQAVLDARGAVVEVSGVREAAVAEFAGTQLASVVAEYPDEEARKDLQVFLPPLPAAEHGPGSTWKDERKFDFGASSRFGFVHEWSVGKPESGTVTISAKAAFEPGPSAPQGQNNSGEGEVSDARSAQDGFVSRYAAKATFTGTGNFDIAATYDETIERRPAGSAAEK